MKPVEVREKTTEELLKLLEKLEKDIFQLNFRHGSGQLKSTSDIKKTRRDLARVLTTLKERELKGDK